jgi:hypothetical protein
MISQLERERKKSCINKIVKVSAFLPSLGLEFERTSHERATKMSIFI